MHDFNLRHATFKQALVFAKLLSGMTNEEISEASGISLAQIARYFQEHDAYAPAPYLLPVLCRVLQNTVLVDWLNAQVEEMRSVPAISTALDLTLALMEAKALQAQFRANAMECFNASDALEALAGGKE